MDNNVIDLILMPSECRGTLSVCRGRAADRFVLEY
jgi:hypothetical protein